MIAIALLSLGILAAATLAALGLRGLAARPHHAAPTIAHRPAGIAAAAVAVPPPPPLAFIDLPPDAARASNAALPFSTERIVAAQPLRYAGAPDDKAKALTCLAAAVLYEAGDDAPGETAVAQVVLNRLRHPAFPKTVCGVVFQGTERPTGCQFTFTCDGALARAPSPAVWQRAREVAAAALAGRVDPVVGTATHYHTDWVVPYWRDSLVKLAKIHTQIFYRWSGWWGTRPAFTGTPQPGEVLDSVLAAFLQSEAPPATPVPLPVSYAPEPAGLIRHDERSAGIAVLGVPPEALRGNVVRAMDRSRAEFVLELDPSAYPGSYAMAALALCGTADRCQVTGWLPEASVPSALPLSPEAVRTASFAYTRARVQGVERAQWNCRRIKRESAAQCLPGTADPAPAAAR